MSCLICKTGFNLGICKPMQICCDTNICLQCLNKNYDPQLSLCNNQHKIVPRDSITPNYSIIEKLLEQEKVQIKGYQLEKNIPITHPSIRCAKQHPLQTRKDFNNNHLCISCNSIIEIGFQYAYCSKCQVNVCLDCISILKLLISYSYYLICECGLDLIWSFYVKCKKCLRCRNKYSNFGSFTCIKCPKKTWCFRCACYLFKPKCFDCSKILNKTSDPHIIGTRCIYCKQCLEKYITDENTVNINRLEVFKSSLRPNQNIIELMTLLERPDCKCDEFLGTNNVQTKCSRCKGQAEDTFYCKKCYKILCLKCTEWVSSSRALSNSEIKCFAGHILRGTQVGDFYKANNTYICDSCGLRVSSFSSHCRPCRVDYCEDCTRVLVLLVNARTVLKCLCNSRIVWRFDMRCNRCSNCRKEFTKSGSFYCECNKTYCILCAFIIQVIKCSNCFKIDQNDYSESLVSQSGISMCKVCIKDSSDFEFYASACENNSMQLSESDYMAKFEACGEPYTILYGECDNHLFTYNKSLRSKCDICSTADQSAYICQRCNYLALTDCKTWYDSSQLVIPKFKCLNGHFLRYIEDAGIYYQRKGDYKCDGCSLLTSGKSAHCRACKVDFCKVCIPMIFALLAKPLNLTCNCNHRLVWVHNRQIKCSSCKKTYSKSGSFLCTGCKHALCIRCTFNKTLPKCSFCYKKLNDPKSLAINDTGDVICANCAGEGIALTWDSENKTFSQSGLSACIEHSFSYLDRSEHFQCLLCYKKNDLWICYKCNSTACSSCKLLMEPSNTIQIPGIKCFNGHFLIKVYFAENDNAKCDGCSLPCINTTAKCIQCNINFCYFCITSLKKMTKILNLICSECSQGLVWRYNKLGDNCKICKKQYPKSGQFFCYTCNTSACIRCAYLFGVNSINYSQV